MIEVDQEHHVAILCLGGFTNDSQDRPFLDVLRRLRFAGKTTCGIVNAYAIIGGFYHSTDNDGVFECVGMYNNILKGVAIKRCLMNSLQ